MYYPPYHSKSNPIERCWSSLGKKWNGRHPPVKRFNGDYPDGVGVPASEMKKIEARLGRSASLPKSDLTI